MISFSEFFLSSVYFIILIFSLVLHEIAHGLEAAHQGDPTARLLGRLTLNPFKHMEWFGSVLLPLVLIVVNAGFVIGWAKPMPYDPAKVRHGRKSLARIAGAGVFVNLTIAVVFGLLIRVLSYFDVSFLPLFTIASIITLVNLALAFFNSIPLYPLDGFLFFREILPSRMSPFLLFMEKYSTVFLVIFLLFGSRVIVPGILALYSLLTGIAV